MERLMPVFIALTLMTTMLRASTIVAANDPSIRYSGRWDMADPLHPRFSWPGVYITVSFTGTSIGILLDDHTNYYNLYIDGVLHSVFHGTTEGTTAYPLVEGLKDTVHTFSLHRRNMTFGEVYTCAGFIPDDHGRLSPPPPHPDRRMEFIGDSFTAAESNETTAQSLPWEDRFPVTNIDLGFAPCIARHFNAEYTTTCRSGSGMVCDWQGNRSESIPARFGRTLMDSPLPTWDFSRWVPDVVVICLGLNDYSGLKDSAGAVSEERSALFRTTYHDFLRTIRDVYPGVRIVAVAAFPPWIRAMVTHIVAAERSAGRTDIIYATFDEFPGGYVGNGHPTVATHRLMADQIIGAMEHQDLFQR